MSRGRVSLAAVLALFLWACTPTLNWREVRLSRLSAWLPCKPDTAQRGVSLAGHVLELNMAGCETAGALFAVSQMRLADTRLAPEVVSAWRTSALANMRGSAVTVQPLRLGANGPYGPGSVFLHAQGQRSDGQALQARLAWFVDGAEVYHIAVYAPQVTLEMSDTLFTQATLR